MTDFSEKNKFRRTPKTAYKNNAPRLIIDEVADIDRNILKMLLKRHNILEKIRKNGKLPAADEKRLRETWQKEATRISSDPELSGSFFALLQSISFRPKPEHSKTDEAAANAKRREAFNLQPPHFPMEFKAKAPLLSKTSRIWLYLACAAGQATRLEPVVSGNPMFHCIKTLEQLGSSLNHTLDNVAVLPGSPLATPDTVIHVGSSEFNFYLFLSHYTRKPSRVKFTGTPPFSLSSLAPIAAFLPQLGCRLTSIIPKSSSLPARLECSGSLPANIKIPSNLPANFILAFCIAAIFHDSPIAVDISSHPEKNTVLEQLLPIFDSAGAVYKLDDFTLNIEPTPPIVPKEPLLPMDDEIAAFLLAFPEPLRGNTTLQGNWPKTEKQNNLWNLLNTLGFAWQINDENVANANSNILNMFKLTQEDLEKFSPLPDYATPLLLALGVCAALAKGKASLPLSLLNNSESQDFLLATGINADENGNLFINTDNPVLPVWNAPSANWAMALALASCANHTKTGFKLGNPGMIMESWSGFWNFFNSLPLPGAKSAKNGNSVPERKGRRIKTETLAIPREIREEDWD